MEGESPSASQGMPSPCRCFTVSQQRCLPRHEPHISPALGRPHATLGEASGQNSWPQHWAHPTGEHEYPSSCCVHRPDSGPE